MSDRLLAAVEALVAKALPELRFLGTWDYTVEVASPGPPVTIEATSNDPSMPPISGVPLRPGPDGGYAVPSPGDVVCIAFANPLNVKLRRPYVVALDPANIPLTATLDAKTLVAIGASAPLTKIGAVPAPLATAAGVVALIGALEVFCSSPGSPPTNGPITPANLATQGAALLVALQALLVPPPTGIVATKTTEAT